MPKKSVMVYIFYYCYCIIIFIIMNHLYAGIYKYIPETNHVSRIYSVAAILLL